MVWLLFLGVTIQAWQAGPPMLTPRFGFGIGVVDNKIYVIGGRTNTTILDVIEVYDQTTHSWETCPSRLPTPRCFMASAVYDDKIYIVGGMKHLGTSYTSTPLVERFDPTTNQWDTVASLNVAREGLGACIFEDKIFAIGGYQCESQGIYRKTVECYDPDSDYWNDQIDSLNIPRINHGVVVYNNKIFVVAGSYYNSLSSVEYYILNQWYYDSLPIPHGSSGLGVANYEDFLYAIAGEDNGTLLSSVYLYHPGSMWGTGPSLSEPRAYLGVAIVNDTIYAIGGKGTHGATDIVEFHALPLPGIDEDTAEGLTPLYVLPTVVRRGTHMSFAEGDEIRIYDATGRLITKGKQAMRIDCTSGIYFIRIHRKGYSPITKKIIIIQ
jgi:hypothetical protein